MSESFELQLPPPPAQGQGMDRYLLDVQIGLGAAILQQPPDRRLPSRDALALHYGLNAATIAVLRRNLVDNKHLERKGWEYFTTRPSTGTTTPHT
jgi:hypothetical protein